MSPNGRWIAYESDRSGRYEVYVERFPELGNREFISTDGGVQPRWSADGEELFYLDLQANRLMSVAVTGEPDLAVGRPRVISDGRFFSYRGNSAYDVTPDGSFVIISRDGNAPGDDAQPHINFVLNWHQELLERVPNP